ncbi:hypothetical protein [Adhaeretor mobilis]|uniref:Uncharacterized protein n=1 Tax=Adhaeretor mobilis TaxID=1930276 RepID=A0A517MTZ3_9BACT|nr:hypothetical protein [Adhaeretor mobilis]QDS98353.1 hypothetical protein HG15A2_16270 [Adhaeretor mobilis]
MSSTGPPPEYTSFGCTLCGTRLSFRVKYVGKKTKCPDCGRVNVIPPPEVKRAVPKPLAMEGEQFELWGVDEAPLPAEQIAKQPTLIPVSCRLCYTLMYAREAHLGKQAKCPDCGTKTLIKRPAAEPTSGPVGVPDGQEYQLDPTSAPTPRPVPKPVAVRQAEIREAERRAYEEKEGGTSDSDAPRKKKRKKKRAALREQPVKFPLVQRVPAMLLTAPILIRWFVLSVFLVVVSSFGSFGAGDAASKFHAVAMVCFFVISCILGILWLAAASAVWLAILTESADGHDELHNPPSTDFVEWIGEAMYFLISAVASAVPAALIGKAMTQLAESLSPSVADLGPVLAGTGWLLAFPVAILSSLEQGSPMAVFSPKIGKSLLTCLPTWLLYYAETMLLIGAAAAGSVWLIGRHPLLGMAAAPVLFAATLLYFRLLGRLAWQLSELTSIEIEGAE